MKLLPCQRKKPRASPYGRSRSLRTNRVPGNRLIHSVDRIISKTLTDELEQATYAYFRELDNLQGMVRAVELGYPQREISHAAYQYQQKVESGEELLVGVNTHTDSDVIPIKNP